MGTSSATQFKPISLKDGYLPIEDHGLIGDGSTAALVGRDGAISWMCVPRFDSPPLFCRLLDATHGGAFEVSPEGLIESRQYYETDSAVLVTEMRSTTGIVRITDALTLAHGADLTEDVKAGRSELLRFIEVIEGNVTLKISVTPLGGVSAKRQRGGVILSCSVQPDLNLHLSSSIPLSELSSETELKAGDRAHLRLRWGRGGGRRSASSVEASLNATRKAWTRWTTRLNYEGTHKEMVRRSALTLKLLDHFETGAIVAAPTSSLPEVIGGERNWDYRYSWVRDAAFTVYALNRIGCPDESSGFLAWVLDAVERNGRPRVLYDLSGTVPPSEQMDKELYGYRGSRPVRWGNAAADQRQHDVFGEILDCAYQWVAHHGEIDEVLWKRLQVLIESAAREWRNPDQGIWEVRTEGRPFTYSAALCHVALDRGARLVDRFKLEGDSTRWRAVANEIRDAILNESWDESISSLTEHLGGGGLDASLLSLPLRRVIPAEHPRMVATTKAIGERLSAGGGLLYRYLPHESPDGLKGREGAFLLCSFWMVDNLAYQGRLDEAHQLFESLCGRANALNLLPEQIDPSTGAFLGNFPQAFSHVGLISSAVNLTRLVS